MLWFISLTAILRAIKFFPCTPVIDKDGHFEDNKAEAKQPLTHFCSTPKSTTGLIRRQPKGRWATVVSKTYYWFLELIF